MNPPRTSAIHHLKITLILLTLLASPLLMALGHLLRLLPFPAYIARLSYPAFTLSAILAFDGTAAILILHFYERFALQSSAKPFARIR